MSTRAYLGLFWRSGRKVDRDRRMVIPIKNQPSLVWTVLLELVSSCVSPIMTKRYKKLDLLPPAACVKEIRPRKSKWKALGLTALLAFAIMLHYTDHGLSPYPSRLGLGHLGHQDVDLSSCPQLDALNPDRHAQLWESLGNDFDQDAFTKRAVDWLGGAVRIPYVAIVLAMCRFLKPVF